LSINARFLLLIALLNAIYALAADPGKNGRIAFVANLNGSNQIYTINPDGTDLFQVTNLPPATDGIAWFYDYSPDGKEIAFGHDMSGRLELYVINADGTGLHQITQEGGAIPHWSPDGSHIVYSTGSELGVGVIATIRADGSERKVISSPFWESLQAEYTPDGKHIVFTTQTGGLVSALWIMDTDGKHQRRLTDPELAAGALDISPDGKQAVFYTNQNTPKPYSNIFRINLNGTGLTRLTSGVHNDTQPVFSPDGRRILYMTDPLSPGSSDIFIMNADGSHKRLFLEAALLPNWGAEPE
jgi:Tol biopolymer transport system component